MSIKLTGLTLFLAGWGLVFLSGPIFEIWFRGQYQTGLQVMPIATAICCLAGLAAMWMNYFLCLERAWLGTVTTGVAVVVNISANLVLVPRFGLLGVAWATLIANSALIACSIWIGHAHQLRVKPATVLFAFLPIAICVPLPIAAGLLVVIVALVAGGRLFNREERATMRELFAHLQSKLMGSS